MIDIHCHLLYGVDDGPTDIEESKKMLAFAAAQGIDKIILTPHFRRNMFPYEKDTITSHYEMLLEAAASYGIELYLGCEYHVDSDMITNFKDKRVYSLADSCYILTEYKNNCEYSYLHKHTQEAIHSGYSPIIAHIERYNCILSHPEYAHELQRMGAMIQINADSVIGYEGRTARLFTKTLLKNHWVDFIGSDSHGIAKRACNLGKAYDYVLSKYGEIYANQLFKDNALSVIQPQNSISDFTNELLDITNNVTIDVSLDIINGKDKPTLTEEPLSFTDTHIESSAPINDEANTKAITLDYINRLLTETRLLQAIAQDVIKHHHSNQILDYINDNWDKYGVTAQKADNTNQVSLHYSNNIGCIIIENQILWNYCSLSSDPHDSNAPINLEYDLNSFINKLTGLTVKNPYDAAYAHMQVIAEEYKPL